MNSQSKSTLITLVLAAVVGLAPAIAESARYKSRDWKFTHYENVLPDGSILTEYAAGTLGTNNPEAQFRIGFVPRFGCEPIISVFSGVPIKSIGDDPQSLANFSVTSFSADSAAIKFASLTEGVDGSAVVYFNGNAKSRKAFRETIDQSVSAAVKLSNGQELAFSLLGSTPSLAFAQKQCQQHSPNQ